ncbi:MAG TPA: 50S ribosomal protein L17, partial [Polyangiaceae bacterium]|nr:50S ribosomal protein L17 [Polyangiaceae bacterium]
IETTDEKAKELRRVAERLITKAVRLGEGAYTPHADLQPAARAKRLHAQRLVGAFLPRFGTRTVDGALKKVDLVEKIFLDLAKRFQGRPGGYTRIVKLGLRRGDGASMSIIEFVGQTKASGDEPVAKEEKKIKKKAAGKKATVAAPASGGAKVG